MRADENAPDLYTVRGEYIYKPFGERITLSGREDRQGFIGKQKDREMNLADHGVRKYDDGLGRFTCPDALWEKFYQWSPYHYCFNNPVNLLDDNGYIPGDKFSSPDVAAHDFGKNYIHKTKENNVEYGAIIYSAVDDDGKKYFSYTIPEKGIENEVTIPTNIPLDADIESAIHTHTGNSKPSSKDKKTADKNKIKSYVVTEDGYIYLYTPDDKKVEKIHNDVDKAGKDSRELPEKDEVDETTGKLR